MSRCLGRDRNRFFIHSHCIEASTAVAKSMVIALVFLCTFSASIALAQPTPVAPRRVSVTRMINGRPVVQEVELQSPAISQVPGQPMPVPTNAQAGPAASPAGATQKFDRPKEVIEQITKLSFDRRPATILFSPVADRINKDLFEDLELPPIPAEVVDQAREKQIVTWELRQLQRDVVRGNWENVKKFFAELPEQPAAQAYQHMLTSLAQPPKGPVPGAPANLNVPQPNRRVYNVSIVNTITPEDVVTIAGVCPLDLKDENMAILAQLANPALAQGRTLDGFLVKLKKGNDRIGGTDDPDRKRNAATLLILMGRAQKADPFLPDEDQPLNDMDAQTLMMLVRYNLATFQQDKKPVQLEKAWKCVQAILTGDGETKYKQFALHTAVELAPKVKEELGQAWLEEGFTTDVERGLQTIANIGSVAAHNLINMYQQPAERLKTLTLQNSAVEALLRVNKSDRESWRQQLNLVAQTWLKEAEISRIYSRSTGSSNYNMQTDMYGNVYYSQPNQDDPYAARAQSGSRQPQPISIEELLEIQPSKEWMKYVDQALILQFDSLTAQLLLRINEPERSFPYIEAISKTNPKHAKELVADFLRVWTQNHDPNSESRSRNRYIYFYGYEQKADAIPLTRSKQQRNLVDLKKWVARLRALPLEELDESLLANAFITSHSSAEVFQLGAIEAVFGDVNTLKPKTIAQIVNVMRTNLAQQWRSVRNQEENKTKRKVHEVLREVIRGYATARTLAEKSLAQNEDDWNLQLSMACVTMDELDYVNSLQKNSGFTAAREVVFEMFQRAADLYEQALPEMEEAKRSTDVYDRWFYTALGAVDIGRISHESVAVPGQFELIKQAMAKLPGESAEWHMSQFANNLFTRMNPLQPQVKFRYLRGGLEVVGEHKRAREAKDLLQYYNDLVTEIKLDVRIDGSDVVGHGEPFGVFVNILHTKEIERESAGFAKYVQNQNNMSYSYNYGRPTENYRDKFQESVIALLGEHFDVVSVTFEGPKTMRSRETIEDGWRITPYAYVLLQAQGAQVDKIPPMQLDLDFLDTSGYAVIPIESAAIPIDASSDRGDVRPIQKLEISQTLDERQADEGRLMLEVKASAIGLVPALDEILELEFDGLTVKNIDDQGVIASEFDKETEAIRILSDRSWLVELVADDAAAEPVTEFSFASPRISGAEMEFQQYADADLVKVDQRIELAEQYATASTATWFEAWMIPTGIAVLMLPLVVVLLWAGRTRTESAAKFEVPGEVNPFTVIGLLRRIREENGIKPRHAEDLSNSINRLEEYYFGDSSNGDNPNLEKIARTWVKKAR